MAVQCCRAAAPEAVTNSPSATRETSATPTPNNGAGFPSQARILRSADFRLVYDHGIRISNPLFAAFCRAFPETESASPRESPRLGITAPRALGGAAVRNRIKRRLREAFRLHRTELHPRWDIVLNPRRTALDAPFPEIERALQKVIERCNSRR